MPKTKDASAILSDAKASLQELTKLLEATPGVGSQSDRLEIKSAQDSLNRFAKSMDGSPGDEKPIIHGHDIVPVMCGTSEVIPHY